MPIDPEHIASLIKGFNEGTLSPAQVAELEEWLAMDARNVSLFNELTDPDQVSRHLAVLDSFHSERSWAVIADQYSVSATPLKRISHWRWMLAAAAVLIFMMVIGWLFLVRNPRSVNETASAEAQSAKEDVAAPAINKAMVTLSDGRMVSLDSIQKGLLADQNGIHLIKNSDGEITYQIAESGSPFPSGRGQGGGANTLTNPRGSRVIDLTLSDGSRVWLNAGSSITYPVAFVGDERRVEITGEAYFEVMASPNPAKGRALKPFIVERGDLSVRVLGTKFNVNAYEDEADIRVTLLEGKVLVSRGTRKKAKDAAATQNSPLTPREIILKPGQQAISNDHSPFTIQQPDLESVMAWKNGRFRFNGSRVEEIMKQLSRWYDIEVVYKDEIGESFVADIERDLPVSKILAMMEMTRQIKFEIRGSTVTVMKY